ncbi:MAG: hypothetical protein KAU50_01255, partial [Candidatus Marinimicrobia bacterium]|nr:hypothetical protein [Candidatus Neomarinimicrobiota bacterium]
MTWSVVPKTKREIARFKGLVNISTSVQLGHYWSNNCPAACPAMGEEPFSSNHPDGGIPSNIKYPISNIQY